MKLSIIVPIYNVAPYLRKCMDSLFAQDITDYEIILVDDGSTDDSGAIADEIVSEAMDNGPWAIDERTNRQSPIANRPRLRVLHQENAGLSEARNTGTRAAQGDYIMYVDSDDFLQPNVLGALLEQVERDQLDVLRFRYQNVKESGEAFAPYKDMTNYNDYSSLPTDGLHFLNERMGTQCYAVQFLLKRELALQELFTPGIYFEDTDWTPRMLLRAKRVASTNLVVYNYLWREGSITRDNNIVKVRKKTEDKLNIVQKLIQYSKDLNDTRWFESMISGIIIGIVDTLSSSLYNDRKVYLQKIKKLDVFPLSYYHIAPRAHKKIRLINRSINLTIMIFRLKNIIYGTSKF